MIDIAAFTAEVDILLLFGDSKARILEASTVGESSLVSNFERTTI